MKLTKEIVSQARLLAWEGKKISDIAKYLNCNQSALYPAIKGKTWEDLIDPKPFRKEGAEVFTCSICLEIKSLKDVHKGKKCNICLNLYKKTLPKNRESEHNRNKKQREKNPTLWKSYQQNYLIDNREKIQKWRKEYYNLNKEHIMFKHKEYNRQPHRIIINRMRKALRRCLNTSIIGKLRHLSYSKEEFTQHLLSTKPKNLNLKDCHIDHIKPLSAFDKKELTNPKSKDFLECWSLSNLRLISAEDNLRKSSKYDPFFTKVF